MSWPGNRAPWMDAAGGVSRTKRDQAQERLYAPVLLCTTCPAPLRQSTAATTAEHTRREALLLSQISLVPFPSSFLFPIQIHRDLASSRIPQPYLPPVCPVLAVCLFSPFPPLRLPLVYPLAPSKHPSCPVADLPHCLGTCHLTLKLDMGLCNPPLPLTRTPLNK